MRLKTLSPDSDNASILAAVAEDGAVIIADVIGPDFINQVTGEIMPYVERTPMGRDDFTGQRTQRTGALVARSPACRKMVMNETILGAARGYLAPFTERITLHLTQVIHIHPNQGAQVLHRDRLAWGDHLPTSIEPQLNTMWALTDFTAANGATRVVPGSHRWDWAQRAEPGQIGQAEMSAGSVLLYSGSVLHSGGQNLSDASRLGVNITYCLAWLRQEENQYLSCPPRIAKGLDPELQELLGYTQGNYALGYFSDPESSHEKADILPPELVLGRKPRDEVKFSLSAAAENGENAEYFDELTRQGT